MIVEIFLHCTSGMVESQNSDGLEGIDAGFSDIVASEGEEAETRSSTLVINGNNYSKSVELVRKTKPTHIVFEKLEFQSIWKNIVLEIAPYIKNLEKITFSSCVFITEFASQILDCVLMIVKSSQKLKVVIFKDCAPVIVIEEFKTELLQRRISVEIERSSSSGSGFGSFMPFGMMNQQQEEKIDTRKYREMVPSFSARMRKPIMEIIEKCERNSQENQIARKQLEIVSKLPRFICPVMFPSIIKAKGLTEAKKEEVLTKIKASKTLFKESITSIFDKHIIGLVKEKHELVESITNGCSTGKFSMKSLLLYGPAGTAKTTMAKRAGAVVAYVHLTMDLYMGGAIGLIKELNLELMKLADELASCCVAAVDLAAVKNQEDFNGHDTVYRGANQGMFVSAMTSDFPDRLLVAKNKRLNMILDLQNQLSVEKSEVRKKDLTVKLDVLNKVLKIVNRILESRPYLLFKVIVFDEVDKFKDSRSSSEDGCQLLLGIMDDRREFFSAFLNTVLRLETMFFLCTANHLESISKAFLNRVFPVPITPNTPKEKIDILKLHYNLMVEENPALANVKLEEDALVKIVEIFGVGEDGSRGVIESEKALLREGLKKYELTKEMVLINSKNIMGFINPLSLSTMSVKTVCTCDSKRCTCGARKKGQYFGVSHNGTSMEQIVCSVSGVEFNVGHDKISVFGNLSSTENKSAYRPWSSELNTCVLGALSTLKLILVKTALLSKSFSCLLTGQFLYKDLGQISLYITLAMVSYIMNKVQDPAVFVGTAMDNQGNLIPVPDVLGMLKHLSTFNQNIKVVILTRAEKTREELYYSYFRDVPELKNTKIVFLDNISDVIGLALVDQQTEE